MRGFPGCKEFTIEAYTYGMPKVLNGKNEAGANLIIGKFCSIANEVVILLGGNYRDLLDNFVSFKCSI